MYVGMYDDVISTTCIAFTLSNFHIASRVEFLHSVSGTVQMLSLATERTALAAVTVIRHR